MEPIVNSGQEKIVKTFKDTNYFAKGTYKRDFIQLFSTATFANFITKTILAPLERWRIIKQTQTCYQLRPAKMNSFSQYLSRVSNEQGWRAFWRGNSAHLWLHGWQVFFQVALLDSIKSTFNEFSFEMQNEPVSKFMLDRVAGPLAASFCTLLLTHPIDTSRIRLSMNYYRRPRDMLFSGITSCWSYIRLEQKKVKAIYRGFVLANLIAVLNLNIFTSVRDAWKEFKKSQNELIDLLASKEVVGSLASLLLLHPLDTIKKNLQLNNQGRPAVFISYLHVYYYLTEVKGAQALYQGLTVTVVRHLLFCPIFALLSDYLDSNVKLF